MTQNNTNIGMKVVGHDDHWQYPAVTEQHAFVKAKELIEHNKTISPSHMVYFGFPWATLIDKVLYNLNYSNVYELYEILQTYQSILSNFDRIVTVCQHIRMLEMQKMFDDTGVTDVFWSHATKDQMTMPDFPHIRLHPFPLYPVQAIGSKNNNNNHRGDSQKWLFSFIGARAAEFYLTDSRNMILDHLSKDTRGIVKGRDKWHFSEIVYDLQIRETIKETDRDLFKQKETEEYKHVLENSLFSLCPSGSGPNSIRLWESIGFGAIPVILADSYLPPGDRNLWHEAAVFCPETVEAVKQLPDRLEKLSCNSRLMDKKRIALKKLWNLYGPDCFVPDIVKLFETYSSREPGRLSYDYTKLQKLAEKISANDHDDEQKTFFKVACQTRLMTNPEQFLEVCDQNTAFRNLVNKYLSSALQSFKTGLISQNSEQTSYKPVVSVITTVLNGARHIEQAITSVINQSYENIEYIIVDGGSTDGTLDIIKKYADHLACFISEPDSGIYDGMNKGLKRAKGDYIMILNSDDYYVTTAVESLVSEALKTGADIVAGHAVFLNSDDTFSKRNRSRWGADVYISSPLRHEAMLVSAEAYKNIGLYDTQKKVISDRLWMIKAFEANLNVSIYDDDIVFFREIGISSNNERNHIHLKECIDHLSGLDASLNAEDYIKLTKPWLLSEDELYAYIEKCQSLELKKALNQQLRNKNILCVNFFTEETAL